MKKILRLTYNDGQIFDLTLPEEEIPSLMEKTRKNELYWDNDDKTAFGLPFENIRYWNILEIPPQVEKKEMKDKDQDQESTV